MTNLIFLHGFLSSPQSRKIIHFKETFVKSKIGDQIRCYNAIDLYPTKQDFENMTVTSIIGNLQKQINQMEGPCWVIGSSHGGLLALALNTKMSDRIAGIVLLAPAINYYVNLGKRFDIQIWKNQGYVKIDTPRFGECKLNYSYYDDLKNYTSWSNLKKPILLIHGKRDTLVPIEDSQEFATIQSDCTEYYNSIGQHNLANVLDEVTDLIISWFGNKLLV